MFKEFVEQTNINENQDSCSSHNFTQNLTSLKSSMICGSGVAFPYHRYTQSEVADLLGIKNNTIQKLLQAKHIQTRHLYLPKPKFGKKMIEDETHEELNKKFDDGILDIGVRAAELAVAKSPFQKSEIDFIVCVTSSGFRVPGMSSIIARAMRLRADLYRLDVVGMGCNAGMSGLRTAEALARTGLKGILLCCEINSAIYVRDESIRTGIVNSLFGDGAAAIVLCDQNSISKNTNFSNAIVKTEILEFASFSIPEEWGAMRFDWNSEQKKWSFGLSKQIPFVVGENLKFPVEDVLHKHGLDRTMIKHWSIHTGGAAVIDGAKKSLGISEHDVRHTRKVMSEFGNISSGSFLVSHEFLLSEGVIENLDYGIMAAMGPGATLEACLVRYHC